MLARFSRRPSLTLVGGVILAVAMANPAAAPPGDLDPTFDGDGKVTTDFAGRSDQVRAVAIQADGKIVAAGFRARFNTNLEDFTLARYNADGSLDTTFDGDGRLVTDFAGTQTDFFGSVDDTYAVAIQADGKIVAAGYTDVSGNNDFALARYNADGSLDTTFDGDGRVITDIADAGAEDTAYAVAIQGDGKIVAAGGGGLFFALARYNSDGSLDTTFDGDGKLTTDFAGGNDRARAVAIQGDGKIVAAGAIFVVSDFALARYNSDGSLDPTFDGDGKVTTDFAGGHDLGFAVAIQGDGKIVVAGQATPSGVDDDFGLARYNSDGSLDTSFEGDGTVTTDFGSVIDAAHSVAVQGDGKIVTAGVGAGDTSIDFALARYNTGGSLDTTFSGEGKVTTDFASDFDQANAVAIQANGRIVAAGVASDAEVDDNIDNDFALARYTCFRRTSRPSSIPICP